MLGLSNCAAVAHDQLGSDVMLHSGFVDVAQLIPSLVVDLRYFGNDNFVGARVDGYEADRVYLAVEAAAALKRVQLGLSEYGLGLKVFDAYRPQQAVDHFVRWALDLDDTKMKAKYYPNVDKSDLFSEGYIAARSGHSRGSTVDVSLVSLSDAATSSNVEELNMGSGWDFFDTQSWPSDLTVTAAQRALRLLLRRVMMAEGFKPLAQEWWHFTLDNEAYPQSYFDFPIR
ncbi:MAG: peptidase M15 [SAR86 cluster bacterium]|uniref:D-alanyl-D-alanine dipeptidase n=1 Tax=SAR86 cluster bacterium TaxID=2030880 RepID=A0A2A4MGQ2_9GAMM|nr:MAG: peptidase M15 [SAR86 cluster bacterium]